MADNNRKKRPNKGPRAQRIRAQNAQMAREKARRAAMSPEERHNTSKLVQTINHPVESVVAPLVEGATDHLKKVAGHPGRMLGAVGAITGAAKEALIDRPVDAIAGVITPASDTDPEDAATIKDRVREREQVVAMRERIRRDQEARAAEAKAKGGQRAAAVASRTKEMDALDATRAARKADMDALRRADMEDPPIDAGKGTGDISSDPAVQLADPNVAPAAVTEETPQIGTQAYDAKIRNTASPEDQRRAKEELRVEEMNRKREAFNEKHGLKEGDRQYKEPRPLPSERRQEKLARDRQNRDRATIRAIQSRPVHRRQDLLNRANQQREERGLPPLGMNGKPIKTNRAIDMTAPGSFNDFTADTLAIGQNVVVNKPGAFEGDAPQVMRYGGMNAMNEPILAPMRKDGAGRYVIDAAAMQLDEIADAATPADKQSWRGQLDLAFRSGGQHAQAAASVMKNIERYEDRIADIDAQRQSGAIRQSEAEALKAPLQQEIDNALAGFAQSDAGKADLDPMPFGPVGTPIPLDQSRAAFGDDLPRFNGEKGPQVQAGIYAGSRAGLTVPGEPEQYKLVVDPNGSSEILYRTPEGLYVGEHAYGQYMTAAAERETQREARAEERKAELEHKQKEAAIQRREKQRADAIHFAYERLDDVNKAREMLGDEEPLRAGDPATQAFVEKHINEYMNALQAEEAPQSGAAETPDGGIEKIIKDGEAIVGPLESYPDIEAFLEALDKAL